MKAILLAAGKGTRISRFIKDCPKSTLPINGRPLIRRTVEIFLKKGIEVIVCTGYKFELIEKALKGLDVTFIHNPFYAVTNSIGTLWLAKQFLDDDVIVMNADVFFDKKILDDLIASKYECVAATDSSRIENGDYFFATNKNGYITKYGKELVLEERTCEYVGIIKINKSFVKTFNAKMDELVNNGEYNLWWENAVYSLADEGKKINTIDFNGYFWSEIDYFDDYERILAYLEDHPEE